MLGISAGVLGKVGANIRNKTVLFRIIAGDLVNEAAYIRNISVLFRIIFAVLVRKASEVRNSVDLFLNLGGEFTEVKAVRPHLLSPLAAPRRDPAIDLWQRDGLIAGIDRAEIFIFL